MRICVDVLRMNLTQWRLNASVISIYLWYKIEINIDYFQMYWPCEGHILFHCTHSFKTYSMIVAQCTAIFAMVLIWFFWYQPQIKTVFDVSHSVTALHVLRPAKAYYHHITALMQISVVSSAENVHKIFVLSVCEEASSMFLYKTFRDKDANFAWNAIT